MRGIGIWIDKLTNSVECVRTGAQLETEFYLVKTPNDVPKVMEGWSFDWAKELFCPDRQVFQMTLRDDATNCLGMLSIGPATDHLFLYLVEASPRNRGASRNYAGVAGNLFAFACKRSVELGFGGFVVFDSKTKLVTHYESTIHAKRISQTRLFLDDKVANQLILRYFRQSFR